MNSNFKVIENGSCTYVKTPEHYCKLVADSLNLEFSGGELRIPVYLDSQTTIPSSGLMIIHPADAVGIVISQTLKQVDYFPLERDNTITGYSMTYDLGDKVITVCIASKIRRYRCIL